MSVCLSRSCILSKRINTSSFLPSGSHIIFFSIPNVMAIFRRGPPEEGVECRRGRQKLRFSANIWLHHVLSTVRPSSVIHAVAPHRGKLVTLIDGKRRLVCCSREADDEVFMTRSLTVMLKTTEQNLVVRSDKSEAAITNNKRLRTRYCTVEAN